MISGWEIEFKHPYPWKAYVSDAEYEIIMNDRTGLVEKTLNLTEDQYYDHHGHYRGSSDSDCSLCGPQ